MKITVGCMPAVIFVAGRVWLPGAGLPGQKQLESPAAVLALIAFSNSAKSCSKNVPYRVMGGASSIASSFPRPPWVRFCKDSFHKIGQIK